MRAATTLRPAFSKRARTCPTRLRATPSGLTMENVRSSAMREIPCGGQKGARLYRSNAKIASNPLKFNAENLPARRRSDREALSTPALTLDVGVVEAEGLVEALFDEVDRRALDQRQALGVDEHFHALVLEHKVGRAGIVGVIDDVGEA